MYVTLKQSGNYSGLMIYQRLKEVAQYLTVDLSE
jgi:hypothetical protein